ncbi:cytochrome c oxidase subunit 3 family protein [uncultured Thalassospira sp.]|uniref:cytochrome c oxidase subunit 3 family protein n=1 Tax=uncultured Thalassospira sp. TaxID=404382 RepID=UPI0030DC2175|tara:strand:- start:347 stop:949 length:603 start_codon:yes stop_codon:yes gene_type:complete
MTRDMESPQPPEPETDADTGNWGGLEFLPGHPLMWVLILSELVVFGAFLLVFSAVRISDPGGFAADQLHLSPVVGGINTIVLLTSGLSAVFALRAVEQGKIAYCRLWLALTAVLGLVFLIVKLAEYGAKINTGFTIDTSTFFTLYFLITGFHALHVVLGLGILGVVALWPSRINLETGTAFWHMVDLIWVLVFPVIYLVR